MKFFVTHGVGSSRVVRMTAVNPVVVELSFSSDDGVVTHRMSVGDAQKLSEQLAEVSKETESDLP